jgi:hypothetical protein
MAFRDAAHVGPSGARVYVVRKSKCRVQTDLHGPFLHVGPSGARVCVVCTLRRSAMREQLVLQQPVAEHGGVVHHVAGVELQGLRVELYCFDALACTQHGNFLRGVCTICP